MINIQQIKDRIEGKSVGIYDEICKTHDLKKCISIIESLQNQLSERIKEVIELIDIHADKIDYHRKINTEESIRHEYFYRGYYSALQIERNRLETISHIQGKEIDN